jgi:hypothetical protein
MIARDITVRKQLAEKLTRRAAALECLNAEVQEFAYIASTPCRNHWGQSPTACSCYSTLTVLATTGLERIVGEVSRPVCVG